MPSSRPSSERSGSIQSQDSPKILQSKADPNVALFEAQPSKALQAADICLCICLPAQCLR